jgi:hypothetical protein
MVDASIYEKEGEKAKAIVMNRGTRYTRVAFGDSYSHPASMEG